MITRILARGVMGFAAAFALVQAGAESAVAADVASAQVEEYRKFAMEHDGDRARGRELFNNEQRVACAKCHSVDGTGAKTGPDLFSAGDQFPRRDLVEAVLRPSATIAVGYSTTVVETKTGEEFQGVLKQATDEWIELGDANGMRSRIFKRDIKQQRGSDVSLMPEGLQAGLSLQEFTDVIEYLVSLKEPAHAATNQRGIPEEIPDLAQPATLRPFLRENLLFSRAAAHPTQKVQPGLVWFEQIPGRGNEFLALDEAGIVWRVAKSDAAIGSAATNIPGETVTVFADLTAEVFSARGPNGLLGMAFHPKFKENGKYYLKHQVFEDGQISTVVVERTTTGDRAQDSGQTGRRVLKIVSGAEHHNGGCMRFGPDGFLYIGMGDSAPNHDPQGHGQDMRLLLGKLLRIDVDHAADGNAYAIPQDNPFVGRSDARAEIWASGLREPWRFSFDALNGDLWVGDLGQERGDEIDIVRRGENFGWNIYEGFELFSPQYKRDGATYVSPIFSTRRKQGITIVGGYVYRGDRRSPFYGVYILGDYTSKRIWAMTQEDRKLKTIRQIALCPQAITAFSQDADGNLYVVGYQGMVYQLDLREAVFN